MAENSDIEWLGHNPITGTNGASGSPWEGCTHKHEGCRNCWAEALNNRWRGGKNWGVGAPRRVATGFGSNARSFARKLAKNGERASWFPSICDPLDPEVWNLDPRDNKDGRADRHTVEHFMQTIRETGEVCGTCLWREDPAECSHVAMPGGIDWLLLTKHPENAHWIPEDVRPYCWLLYSASDQKSLEAGISHLLAAQGFAGLGLSLEPLIGPVNIGLLGTIPESLGLGYRPVADLIRWVLLGGESGPKARPFDVAWGRAVRRECQTAGVACFWKQFGARSVEHNRNLRAAMERLRAGLDPAVDAIAEAEDREGRPFYLRDKKGVDMSEWPEDCRVREFPEGLRRG